jgi:DNA-binding CsgD family transcriptional regulator
LRSTPFRCFTDDDVLAGASRRDFAIYDDLFHPTDADHSAQIRLGNVNGIETGLTLMRSRGFGGFERPTLNLIEHAASGIASAVFAAVALGVAHERSVVATAEALGGIAILLGTDRAIVSLSPAAEQVLRDGRVLTVRAGRLAAIDPADDQALERAFRLASLPNSLEARQSRLAVTTLDGTRTLDLCPLPRRMSGPIAQARVLLTMPLTSPDRDITLVGATETFGLTPAESAVAALLASGCTPRQIAERRGSAISTVRHQLKMLFEKTGTHRQAELVMLLGPRSRS